MHQSQVNMCFLRGSLRWLTKQKNPKFLRGLQNAQHDTTNLAVKQADMAVLIKILFEFTLLFYGSNRHKNRIHFIQATDCFHVTSRPPYWCPKPVRWELNSFLMQTLSFVPINLHRCWPREWKRSVREAYNRIDFLFTGSWADYWRWRKRGGEGGGGGGVKAY